MEKQEKINAFQEELKFVKNLDIHNFAEKAIQSLPDYFFEIPASSTGKYHPAYALGQGGLLRHTKAAVRIAIELFRTELWQFTEEQKDLILVGLMLHDGYKSGINHEKFSQANHPLIITKELEQNEELISLINANDIDFLFGNIETHMGKWNYDYKTKKVIMNKPETIAQRFTHLCDYIASQKCLEFNFDAEISEE
jgi:hypothetical protein